MVQPKLDLYHFPDACSRVSVCALEWASLSYALHLVDLSRSAQHGVEYQSMHPLAKVPLLLIDGRPLAENAAIICFAAALRPDSGFLPRADDPVARADIVSGLSFCSATLHPAVRGFVNPLRFTVGDPEPVREKSRALLLRCFSYAEQRLADRGWWLGVRSIIDVYLEWAFWLAKRAELETSAFPMLSSLTDRLLDLPAYGRMQEEERLSHAELKAQLRTS